MSQKYWRLVFVVAIIFKSSCIFTTKVLYFIKIRLAIDNMDIHLVFTLWSSFKPLAPSNLSKVPRSKCILSEDEKYVYIVHNKPSLHQNAS
jgi:hypothetical protein